MRAPETLPKIAPEIAPDLKSARKTATNQRLKPPPEISPAPAKTATNQRLKPPPDGHGARRTIAPADDRTPLDCLVAVHGVLTSSDGPWFGFDCGHGTDLSPALIALCRRFPAGGKGEGGALGLQRQYRTFDFIRHKTNLCMATEGAGRGDGDCRRPAPRRNPSKPA